MISMFSVDAVFVFYNVGSENVASLCPYKPHNPRIKHSLPSSVSNFIYARKFRVLHHNIIVHNYSINVVILFLVYTAVGGILS